MEISEWDFKVGPLLPKASLLDKVKLFGAILGIFPRLPYWTYKYFSTKCPLKFGRFLLYTASKYIGRRCNEVQLRILAPAVPIRELLETPKLKEIGEMLPHYNHIFHVENASARWISELPNRSTQDPVLLYFHGGGYFMTAMPTQVEWCMLLAEKLKRHRVSVLALDYMVAPMGKHPAQLHEAIACYMQLQKSCNKIITIGDSAGGHLAIMLQDYLCRSSIPRPYGTVLLSPWTEMEPRKYGSQVTCAWLDAIEIGYNTPEWFFSSRDDFNDPRANPLRGGPAYWAGKFGHKSLLVWSQWEVLGDVCHEFAEMAGIKEYIEPNQTHDPICFEPYTCLTGEVVLKALDEWLE